MSVGPRIIFLSFDSQESQKLVPWVTHAARVVGDRPSAPDPQTSSQGNVRSVWQMVSSNNRQLARGLGVHGSFEQARSHAKRVADSGADLIIEYVSEPGRGVYGWFANLAGEPVMTCARWYLTKRDQQHSSELAARSVSVAALLAGARLADPSLIGGRRGATV
jgi:hypothetical protein